MLKNFSNKLLASFPSAYVFFWCFCVLLSCKTIHQEDLLDIVFIQGIHDDPKILTADSLFLKGKLKDAAFLFLQTQKDVSNLLYCQARLAEMDYFLRELYGENHENQTIDSAVLPHPITSIDSFLVLIYDFYSQERLDTAVFKQKWGRVIEKLGTEHYLSNIGHAILGEYFYTINFNDRLLGAHFKIHQNWCRSLPQKIYDGYWTNLRLASSGTYERNNLESISNCNELIVENNWLGLLDSVHLSLAYGSRGYILFRFDRFQEAFEDNRNALLLCKGSKAIPVYQEALKSQLTVTNFWPRDSLWHIYMIELKKSIEKNGVDYVNYHRHVARYFYERGDFNKSSGHHALAIEYCLAESKINEPVLESLSLIHSIELEKIGKFSEAIMVYRLNEIKCEDPFWTYAQLLDSVQLLDKYQFVSLSRYAHIYYSWYLNNKNLDLLEKSEELALKGHELYYRDVETRDENVLIIFNQERNSLMEVLCQIYAEKYITLNDEASIIQYHRYAEENRGAIFWKDMKSEWAYDSVLISYLILEQQLNAENKFLKFSHNMDPSKIKENLDQLSLLNLKIKQEFPQYFRQAFKKETPSLHIIQDALTKQETSLISFDIIEDQVYLFWIKNKDLELFRIPITEDRMDQLNQLMQWSSTPSEISASDYATLAYGVWQWLIPDNLKKDPIDRWVIVPDGFFHRLNLEVLVTDTTHGAQSFGELAWLILDKEIIHSPLIKSWLSSDSLTRLSVLNVIGFSWSDKKTIAKLNRTRLAELPGTITEMESLNSSFPGAQIYSGENATLSNFVYRYEDPDIKLMEIALHGKSSSNVQDEICLYFRSPGNNIDTFYGYELLTMDSKVETIILTACETGIGKVVDGEGNINFARYFLANGAKSVLTSLWKLDDMGAFSLGIELHQLSSTRNLSNIIRLNKLKMIQSKQKNSHPYYWAVFTHYT